MILFRPEHVTPILEGRKTQTRRMGQKRWNVGAVHQAKTRLFGVEPFAHLWITEVRREWLDEMSQADARAEGYPDRGTYWKAFDEINHANLLDLSTRWPQVWVVQFELVHMRSTLTGTPV